MKQSESAAKPRKKVKQQKAVELMAEHYTQHIDTLPDSVRQHRGAIVKLIMEGQTPAEAFAQVMAGELD